ncbi:MAG: gliding motility-associated C-terminal domain-containing protein [Saprospiraceae bacterium]|nr:gliding motility-associated C-terminal domain-containing protein [Saprospiraceae bacterium]
MYYLRFILIFILLIECLGTEGNAQCLTGHEQDQWYITGNGILDFRLTPPKVTGSTMFSSYELTAQWCDNQGNILLYTNGYRIFNKKDQTLPNGKISSGFSASSTHGLILPRPGSDSLFDVFIPESTDSHDSLKTLWHVVVDLSLDGGLGAVVGQQEAIYKGTSERVAATQHCNGSDWWVIGRAADNNRFISWQLSPSGLGVPIYSDVGNSTSPYNPTLGCSASTGQMTFSPDGNRLAIIYPQSNCQNDSIALNILPFDNGSGMFSVPTFTLVSKGGGAGIQYSPDGTKLYFNWINLSAVKPRLYQQDLLDPASPPVRVLPQYPPGETINIGGRMATGPDGRIYVSDYPKEWYHVIPDPNEKAPACGFLWKGLDLSPATGGYGMPTIPAGYWRPNAPWLSGQRRARSCEQWTYTVSHTCAPGTYTEWAYHGANTVTFSDQDSLVLDFHTPGRDTLIATRFSLCDTVSDTLVIVVDDPFTKAWDLEESTLCAGASTRLFTASLPLRELNGTPFTSDTLTLGPFAADSCFALRLSDGVCDTTVTLCLTVLPAIQTTDTLTLCPGVVVPVHGQPVSQPGVYPLVLPGQNGCDSTSVITVIRGDVPQVETDVISSLCPDDDDGEITLIGDPALTWTWADGSTDPQRGHMAPGVYSVTVSGVGQCDTILEFTLPVPEDLSLILPGSVSIHAGASTTLVPQVNGIAPLTWAWLPVNGLSCTDCERPVASPTATTTYTLTLTDSRGCTASAQVTVIVDRPVTGIYFPTAFSPNADGINDTWSVLAGEDVAGIELLEIFDRWGGLLHRCADLPLDHPHCAWDGTSNGQHVDPGMYLWQARILLTDGTVVQRQGEVEVVK